MRNSAEITYLSFTFLASFLIACGKVDPRVQTIGEERDKDSVLKSLPLPDRMIDPYLKPFLDEFRGVMENRTLREKNKLASLGLRDLPSGYAGYCITKQLNSRDTKNFEGYVVIDNQLSELQLKAVLWHELGHCLFNLKHTPDQGIMNEYIPSDSVLSQSWSNLEIDYLELVENETIPSKNRSREFSADNIGLKVETGRLQLRSVTHLPFR